MIDLRSDTVTMPDASMREAISAAEVGDDVYGEDPTVNRLEAAVSDILGTDDALYCPSGTMANQVAVNVWTDPGDEFILEKNSHIFNYEVGGAARHSSLQTRPIDGSPRGVLSPEDVDAAIRSPALHIAGTGLLALENTHNSLGGRALTVDEIESAASVAHERDIPVHLDGARLWNAAVATGVDPSQYVDVVDSVMVCLSKGLGAPVGSLVAGPADFIEQARRTRKAFGGGMRQAGVIAAAGLEALENRSELEQTHRLASRLADELADLSGVSVIDPETNIVIANLDPGLATAAEWLDAGVEHGIAGTDMGEYAIRYVTHRDVDKKAVDEACERLRELHASLV